MLQNVFENRREVHHEEQCMTSPNEINPNEQR